MPKAIPEGITSEDVLRALQELDQHAEHPFSEPTGYCLLHNGKFYPPKAVVGVAARQRFGTILNPQDFSGGEAHGQANDVLRRLGFEIVPKSTGSDWSQREVDLTVADYFEMLASEIQNTAYSKTAHRHRLRPLLDGRSDGSVEFKHQNISAVFISLGLPYIEGYKPRGNYQGLLAQSVEKYLAEKVEFFERLQTSPRLNPLTAPAPTLPLDQLFELPPDEIIVPLSISEPWKSRKGRRIDFARRDAENRLMAKLGEQFVVEVERTRLSSVRRDDLAAKVDWVAQTLGDGLGFDILSYDEHDDSERLIEVKTTGLGKFFPFYVTSNEVRCSEAMAQQYHLYRLFTFSQTPRLYTLRGALSSVCRLEPIQFRASLGQSPSKMLC